MPPARTGSAAPRPARSDCGAGRRSWSGRGESSRGCSAIHRGLRPARAGRPLDSRSDRPGPRRGRTAGSAGAHWRGGRRCGRRVARAPTAHPRALEPQGDHVLGFPPDLPDEEFTRVRACVHREYLSSTTARPIGSTGTRESDVRAGVGDYRAGDAYQLWCDRPGDERAGGTARLVPRRLVPVTRAVIPPGPASRTRCEACGAGSCRRRSSAAHP
jgi:hypothetical protein